MRLRPGSDIVRYLALSIVIAMLITCGCSGGDSFSPAAPGMKSIDASSSHQCRGLWQFIADPASGTLDVVPLRTSEMHINALPFLEPPALVNITLETLQFNGNIIETDIGLRHPFLGLDEFSGFDVCGIFIGDGSVGGFDDASLLMPGDGDTRLLNPDGFTRWWNPSEFPVNEGTMFSYNDGLLGTPDSIGNFSATLNGYKYFCDDLTDPDGPLSDVTLDGRGLFSAGQKNVRHYTIQMEGGLVFNYAVDACWKFPNGSPPYDVPDDFAPDANRPEAWQIAVEQTLNTLWNDGSDNGGELALAIDVYDWYNADMNTVRVESPGNFAMTESAIAIGGGAGYSTYAIDITDATPAEGSIDLLISIESDSIGYGGLLPGKPVTSYFTKSVAVSDEAPPSGSGWVDAWGNPGYDCGWAVAADEDGNAYVSGNTNIGGNGQDAFLAKYAPDGTQSWYVTWGGTGWDEGYGVDVDGYGNVYVAGDFQGTVDFDPGAGVTQYTSNSSYDIYVSKFDPSGDFLWARAWGSSAGQDSGMDCAVDSEGNVCVVGRFMGTNVDFDPGAGTDLHSANGFLDIFISVFDPSGDYQWARTWGCASDYDGGWGVVYDGSDSIYAVGDFYDTVDFDPGAGVDNHASNGSADGFLVRYDSSGNFIWARTWGGPGHDEARGDVDVDGAGSVYVQGRFNDTVDFDPGAGIDNHTSNGDRDIFLSKFNTSGDFQWARTWGSTYFEYSNGVAVHGTNSIYTTGCFNLVCDFDPGAGVYERTSAGDRDAFINKFDADGNFIWARTWGGTSCDEGNDIAVDGSGNAFVTGWYWSANLDFAPSYPPCNNDPDVHSANGYDIYLVKYLPNGCWE